jgi:hypothetical protein
MSQIEILNVTGEKMPGRSINQFTHIEDEHNTTDSVQFCSAKRPNKDLLTINEMNIVDRVFGESEANMTATDRRII